MGTWEAARLVRHARYWAIKRATDKLRATEGVRRYLPSPRLEAKIADLKEQLRALRDLI